MRGSCRSCPKGARRPVTAFSGCKGDAESAKKAKFAKKATMKRRKIRKRRGSESRTRGGREDSARFERLLPETLHMAKVVFGPRHPHFALALKNYTAGLRALGRTEGANAAAAQAEEIRDLISIKGLPRVARRDRRSAQERIGDPRFPSPDLLDLREAARYLSVSVDTMYRLVRSGELPHTRVRKAIRVWLADLDRYLESRTSRNWARVDWCGRPRRP
jgi:excisionase family DNA binding protein